MHEKKITQSTAIKLSEWIFFALSLKIISRDDYAQIHQPALQALISADHTRRFAYALKELQFARESNQLTHQDYLRILTHQHPAHNRFINKALCSAEPLIIESIINYAGEDILIPNAQGHNAVQILVRYGNSEALEVFFIELNKAMTSHKLPTSIYTDILFSTHTDLQGIDHYLLSLSFHPLHLQTSQVILKNAKHARSQDWIDLE